jgi:hypothetical protein
MGLALSELGGWDQYRLSAYEESGGMDIETG